MKYSMLFPAVLIDFPNSKVCQGNGLLYLYFIFHYIYKSVQRIYFGSARKQSTFLSTQAQAEVNGAVVDGE